MQIFRRVLFHVQARDSDFLRRAFHLDLQPPLGRERQLVHGNLIALRQIGIEIIFAGESRKFVYPRPQCQRRAHRQFHRLAIQHRQRARQSQAHRARVLVRRGSKSR